MKKTIQTLSKAIQVVLAAPVKLPGKVFQVAQYIGLALTVLDAVTPEQTEKRTETEKEESDETD